MTQKRSRKQKRTTPRARVYPARPLRVAFTSGPLADKAATLDRVLTRLRDGSYFVALRFDTPVRFHSALITLVDANTSQLTRI